MLPAGFEPAIPASEQPQTHALDRAATEIVCNTSYSYSNILLVITVYSLLYNTVLGALN